MPTIRSTKNMRTVSLVVASSLIGTHAFSVPALRPTIMSRKSQPCAGLFDGLFQESEEQKRIKDEQLAEMKKLQELRRDPEAWEAAISARRNQEAELKRAQMMQAAGVLPEGWGSATDPASGDTYYYKKATKETQWEFPTEAC